MIDKDPVPGTTGNVQMYHQDILLVISAFSFLFLERRKEKRSDLLYPHYDAALPLSYLCSPLTLGPPV